MELAPQELPTPPQPTATTMVLAQTTPRRTGTCQVPSDTSRCKLMAHLRVGHVDLSSSTCYVDARVREGEQGRLLQCPDGVVAVFSRAAFGGALAADGIDTCLRTQFPFSDGCTWETMQTVRGGPSLLSFAYVERPVSGESCASSSCTAHAEIEVLPP